MTFKIGDRVRVKEDTKWHGIPLDKGWEGTVLHVSSDGVWFELDGGEGAQDELNETLLENITKLTPWGQFWASAYEQALATNDRSKVEEVTRIQRDATEALKLAGITF